MLQCVLPSSLSDAAIVKCPNCTWPFKISVLLGRKSILKKNTILSRPKLNGTVMSGQLRDTISPPSTKWSTRWRTAFCPTPGQCALATTLANSRTSAGEATPSCLLRRWAQQPSGFVSLSPSLHIIFCRFSFCTCERSQLQGELIHSLSESVSILLSFSPLRLHLSAHRLLVDVEPHTAAVFRAWSVSLQPEVVLKLTLASPGPFHIVMRYSAPRRKGRSRVRARILAVDEAAFRSCCDCKWRPRLPLAVVCFPLPGILNLFARSLITY